MNEPVLFIYRKEGGRQSEDVYKRQILFVDSCMWIYSQYAGGFSVYVSSG